MYLLQKLNLLLHQIIYWIYNDADKAFFTGGFVGAGFTSTLFHLNYWYWAKVIVSAIIGGVINILIKKVVDRFFKKKGGNNE
jgi:phosphate/sulfate permease